MKLFQIKNAQVFRFNKLKSIKLHKSTCTQLIHSAFDPLIYSISYDTHMTMIGYEFISNADDINKYDRKEKKKLEQQLNKSMKITKLLDITNSNKSYFTSLHINNMSQVDISNNKGTSLWRRKRCIDIYKNI